MNDPESPGGDQQQVERMELMSSDEYSSTSTHNNSRCKNRLAAAIIPSSCKEGVLTVACVNLFILVFVLSALLNVSKTNGDTEICQSPSCVQLAATLVSNMNKSVDPCDDFYEYTCGGWIQHNPIPDDKARYSTFSQLYEQNENVLRRILDQAASNILTTKNVLATSAKEKAIYVYKSCMDVEAIESEGSKPLAPVMAVLTNWRPTNGLSQPLDNGPDRIKLAQVMANLWDLGVEPFLSSGVGADDKNSTRNVMFVSQGGLSLPSRSYYVGKKIDEDKSLLALQELIVGMLGVYEDSPAAAAAHQQRARAIVSLEQRLATSMATPTELRNPLHSYNVLDLSSGGVAPWGNDQTRFNWLVFLQELCKDDCIPPTEIVASSPSYLMKGMDATLRDTESGIILDYLKWRVLSSFSKHLDARYQVIQLKFSKEIYGVDVEPARWKLCVSRTDSAVGFALGELYVQASFGGSSRDIALEMIGDIRDVFEKRLEKLTWMDATTRERAKEKAEAVSIKIGYPKELQTSEELNTHYLRLEEIGTTTYFHNMLAARKYGARRNIEKLNQQVDRTSWSMTPPTVNAYYSPSYNEIVFPAGILQPPFFEQGYLHASNYGGIGVVIGHELTHGFDDQGSQYDKNGNLKPWWAKEVEKNFQKKTECIAEQYSEYVVEERLGVGERKSGEGGEASEASEHVNGNLTLGENIADNGGLVQAFGAYRAWVERNGMGEERRLPGLAELTANQLFFLSFATVWCGDAKPGEAHRLLVTDPHSPGKYRVIGTLSNSEDFAREFGCKVGTRMNPKEKCAVW